MTVPSIQSAMRKAVEDRVNTLPMKSAYPVVWTDGKAYTPSPDQPYLRATWFPNTTRRLFLNGSDPHQRLSILEIDVMEKKTRTGVQATEVAGQVAAHFPADLKMVSNGVTCRVTAAPHIPTAIAGDVFMQVPIMISIETFA